MLQSNEILQRWGQYAGLPDCYLRWRRLAPDCAMLVAISDLFDANTSNWLSNIAHTNLHPRHSASVRVICAVVGGVAYGGSSKSPKNVAT